MSKHHVYKVPALAGDRVFTTEAGAKSAIRDDFKHTKRWVRRAAGSPTEDQAKAGLAQFPMTIVEYELVETERELSWPPEEDL